MGKWHAVNADSKPVILFATRVRGLTPVLHELQGLGQVFPAVVVEWEIPLCELEEQSEVLECMLRHLCAIKRGFLPQLVVNVNISVGVYANGEDEENKTKWLVDLSTAKRFQIQYLNAPIPVFHVRLGRTPVCEALRQLVGEEGTQRVKVFANTKAIASACRQHGKHRIERLL